MGCCRETYGSSAGCIDVRHPCQTWLAASGAHTYGKNSIKDDCCVCQAKAPLLLIQVPRKDPANEYEERELGQAQCYEGWNSADEVVLTRKRKRDY